MANHPEVVEFYLCTLCGEVEEFGPYRWRGYSNPSSVDTPLESHLCRQSEGPEEFQPGTFRQTHACPDGRAGFWDLIGAAWSGWDRPAPSK